MMGRNDCKGGERKRRHRHVNFCPSLAFVLLILSGLQLIVTMYAMQTITSFSFFFSYNLFFYSKFHE